MRYFVYGKGSVDISWGKRLYDDLVQAQQSLVVANHLHLLYLSTPYDVVEDVQPDWMLYLQQV
jgi:POLQ-like helicase